MLRDSPEGSSSRCSAAREVLLPRCTLTGGSHRTIDPHALKIPAPEGAESTLTENVASPFHAEPRHVKFERFSDEKTSATCSARPQAAVRKSGNGMPKPFPQHAPHMSLVHGPLQFILLRSQDSQ